jgi:hypothetical protein
MNVSKSLFTKNEEQDTRCSTFDINYTVESLVETSAPTTPYYFFAEIKSIILWESPLKTAAFFWAAMYTTVYHESYAAVLHLLCLYVMYESRRNRDAMEKEVRDQDVVQRGHFEQSYGFSHETFRHEIKEYLSEHQQRKSIARSSRNFEDERQKLPEVIPINTAFCDTLCYLQADDEQKRLYLHQQKTHFDKSATIIKNQFVADAANSKCEEYEYIQSNLEYFNRILIWLAQCVYSKNDRAFCMQLLWVLVSFALHCFLPDWILHLVLVVLVFGWHTEVFKGLVRFIASWKDQQYLKVLLKQTQNDDVEISLEQNSNEEVHTFDEDTL